jgi:hypothetical protein
VVDFIRSLFGRCLSHRICPESVQILAVGWSGDGHVFDDSYFYLFVGDGHHLFLKWIELRSFNDVGLAKAIKYFTLPLTDPSHYPGIISIFLPPYKGKFSSVSVQSDSRFGTGIICGLDELLTQNSVVSDRTIISF